MASSCRTSAGTDQGSRSQLENTILDYLKKNPGAQHTLHIAKGVGLQTAKDVNSTLYGLQKKQLICKGETGKPMWSLKSSTAPSRLCSDESSQKAAEIRWIKSSERWRGKLQELTTIPKEELVAGLTQIRVCTKDQFKIGDGCDGTSVYVGLLVDGREVAVKEVLKKNSDSLEREIGILAKIKPHSNVVAYKLSEWPDGKFGYIATELCDYTLKAWLLDQAEADLVAVGLVRDLLEGLYHLHGEEVLHRDLKPENVLVVITKGSVCLKVADFSISRQLEADKDSYHSGAAGTRCWQASEVIKTARGTKVRYTRSVDVQVAGMLIFYILTKGKHPFGNVSSETEVQHNILKGEHDLKALSCPLAKDLVKDMLVTEPDSRPSAQDLVNHPYLWDSDKRCEFLAALGNEPEIANDSSGPASPLTMAIEGTKGDVLPNGKDWNNLSVKPLLRHQKPFRTPGFTSSVCKLLRTFRNVNEHYNEQSADAKKELGNNPNPFEYFHKNFPHLLTSVYSVIRESKKMGPETQDWTQRDKLKPFFSPSVK